MRVDFAFDSQKAQRQGYTVAGIFRVLEKNFAARNLPCTIQGDCLSVTDRGREGDSSSLWSVIMALLRKEWFVNTAAACTWYDDDGTEEDVLSQAWKVRGQRMA